MCIVQLVAANANNLLDKHWETSCRCSLLSENGKKPGLQYLPSVRYYNYFHFWTKPLPLTSNLIIIITIIVMFILR